MNKKKVIILGGGIGGLTVAHELSKRSNEFDITIVERNEYVGGQAARIVSDDTSYYTHWHSITSGDKYFLDIINQVTTADGRNVISFLKPLNNYVYCLNNNKIIENSNTFIAHSLYNFKHLYRKLYNKKLLKKDIMIITYILIYSKMISEKRLLSYDKILWKDYIKNFSPAVKRFSLNMTTVYMGIDYNKVSTYAMFVAMRNVEQSVKINNVSLFHSFYGPLDVILFEPWKTQLEAAGVKFLLNHKITKMYHTSLLSTISTISVQDNLQKLKYITGDIFVNSLDLKSIAELYPINNKFNELYENSKHMKLQVLFRLQNQSCLSIGNDMLIFLDSPWLLSIRIECNNYDICLIDYMSCIVGIYDQPGSNKKNAINCTREELASECWKQINAAKHNLIITDQLPEWSMWNGFYYNNDNNTIKTYNSKFSTNINTQSLRPNFIDKNLLNLYHATAYANTHANSYNIESGAEAGVKAANIICLKKDNIVSIKNDDKKIKHLFEKQKVSPLLKIVHTFDKYIYLLTKMIKKKIEY